MSVGVGGSGLAVEVTVGFGIAVAVAGADACAGTQAAKIRLATIRHMAWYRVMGKEGLSFIGFTQLLTFISNACFILSIAGMNIAK